MRFKRPKATAATLCACSYPFLPLASLSGQLWCGYRHHQLWIMAAFSIIFTLAGLCIRYTEAHMYSVDTSLSNNKLSYKNTYNPTKSQKQLTFEAQIREAGDFQLSTFSNVRMRRLVNFQKCKFLSWKVYTTRFDNLQFIQTI